MFGTKKKLKEIELAKQQLLFIKEQLEDTSPKVDISNVYVWKYKGIFNLVKLQIENIRGNTFGGIGPVRSGYKSTLIDIFTNEVIYEKSSISHIKSNEYISEDEFGCGHYAYFYSIYDAEPNLLAYIDKKVPLYVLQQVYYDLNKVNTNAPILKKEKKC